MGGGTIIDYGKHTTWNRNFYSFNIKGQFFCTAREEVKIINSTPPPTFPAFVAQ